MLVLISRIFILLLAIIFWLSGEVFAAGVSSKVDQTTLVNIHNLYRSEVGINKIDWSPTVAKSALKWAKDLESRGCPLEHSEEKFRNGYGENLYEGWSSSWKFKMRSNDAVRAWWDEKPAYDYTSNSCTEWEMCGHYTQVTWGATKHIGCAKARCTNDSQTTEILVCQYDPPGNYIGQRGY